jgi:hypothetical protein
MRDHARLRNAVIQRGIMQVVRGVYGPISNTDADANSLQK